MGPPTTIMGPPTNPRKRKAPTLRAEDWEPYKARIIELHIKQKLPLRKVKDTIESELGFKAELRQYRTRISQWDKDKNVKTHEMKAIVRKRQQRRLVESEKGKQTFTVRGKEVKPPKIERWMKKNDIPEGVVYAPSPAESTPSAVNCRTISERGSPAPSLTYSVASPIFPMRGASIAQSPGPFSPASSVTSVLRASASTFTGQSPAPIHRVLLDLRPGSMPDPEAFLSQIVSSEPHIVGSTPQIRTGQEDPKSVQYRYRQADEELLKQELVRMETPHGDDHSETLSTLYELSVVLMDQGRYRSAEEMIRRLVEARQNINGNDDDDTMGALDLLGGVLRYQGSYAKAEKLYRRTFEFRKHTLGCEHASTLASMANLATTYWEQGRLKEAEELEVQVMETMKRVLGEEHPDTLHSVGNLAATYQKQGRLKEAEELEVQVLEMRKRVLGKEHPHTLQIMNDLACTWKS
ncbi:hypothetical protein W97_02919 [Coniosporium apollinis CBS 100218]|uniref:Clr5 domain-containing protein n=1 Tax=Coniosporium apollinis (strain CBS 100218) TaxID=1168221 RepID=R7YPX0_CONA1|nr:uncharacterized protein W97_02919 [Coniosporium apollinis CBS 100218]EON63691.1 hypothetical protein W97_02919 [Coniosporium apollinis CBS 100218]